MKTFKQLSKTLNSFKSPKTPEQIAKKHNVPLSQIEAQFKIGHKVEREHTNSDTLAYVIASHHIFEFPNYYTKLTNMEKTMKEGTLHHWFKGSKSKDGKPGWVQADGSPCANEKGEAKTPKCFSSGRLNALKKKGKSGLNIIRSAIKRKREKDPNQQDKSGSAKPTMVNTFSKGRKNKHYVKAEPTLKEATKDIPGKSSGTKDACYHKVKSRFKVWPSAYGSAALVKCRKAGAKNWGKSKIEEEYTRLQSVGNTYSIVLSWRGTTRMVQFFVPGNLRPTKKELTYEVSKIYPGATVLKYAPCKMDTTKPYFFYNKP
jgi:hypothetical protein